MKVKLSKKLKIFCDGADFDSIIEMNKKKHVQGFTTNPSLMKSSGIKNYEKFARKILKHVKSKSVSFEVFSDDLNEMAIQAEKISSWADNVYVKIPITNTRGQSCIPLISNLIKKNIKVNVTAVFTLQQIQKLSNILDGNSDCIISIFSGRIADTGIDPEVIVKKSLNLFIRRKKVKILWASTRELLNIYQASNLKCHIITVPHSMLGKLNLANKNLTKYSLETVKMFYDDAKKAGYSL